MTSDDDELDDASLRSMRAVWLSMREEEPPAAGMSALLAAARERAERMQEEPSWFARAFAMLRRPPVLAFATIILLVGGAVIINQQGTRKVDSMVADERAPTMTSTAPDRDDRELAVGAARTIEEQPANVDGATVAPIGAGTASPSPAPAEPVRADPARATKPKRPPPSTPSLGGARQRDFELSQRETESAPNLGAARGPGGRGDDFTQDALQPTDVGARGVSPEPPPPPQKTQVVKPTSRQPPVADEPEDVTIAERGGSPATPPIDQLVRQAESAASRKDCAAVRVIVARIRKQDEDYYRQRILKNTTLGKCL